jgi:hypothetical protein
MVLQKSATMRAYFKSVEPCMPIENVCTGLSDKLQVMAVTKLESRPPDKKHPMGRSVLWTRFSTALKSKCCVVNTAVL